MLQPYRRRRGNNFAIAPYYRAARTYGPQTVAAYQAAKFLGKRAVSNIMFKSRGGKKSASSSAKKRQKNTGGNARGGGGWDGRIRRLERTVIDDISTRTFRKLDYSREASAVNQKLSLDFTGVVVADIESALTGVRFWDSSTSPGSFKTGDLKGAESQQCQISSVDSKLMVRNNGVVDCHVELYLCVPKVDTSLTILNTYQNGLAAQGNPDLGAVNSYLTDSEQFKKLWKIKTSKKMLLRAGTQTSLSYHFGPFSYNPAIFDDHADVFQKKLAGHAYMIRCMGVISHLIATPTTVGSGACSVDVYRSMKIVVKYDSGGPTLRDLHYEDNGAAAVLSSTNKPESAQQVFA